MEERSWITGFIGSVTVAALDDGGYRVDFDVSVDEADVDLGENSDDPPTDDEVSAVRAAITAVFADPLWKGSAGSRSVVVTRVMVEEEA